MKGKRSSLALTKNPLPFFCQTDMSIVVLDGYTLNPGDLSWDALAALGPCAVYDRSEPEETVPRARDARIVLINKTALHRAEIERLPNLEYIGVLATGYNVLDLKAAAERKIVVTNVPSYSTPSVAQMVFAHLLNLTQRVGDLAETVRRGDWSKSADFCYWNAPLVELQGLRIGIVGFGQTGRATAKLAQAFGMRVLIHSRRVPDELPEGAEFVSLEELLEKSDVVSLHCPLTAETRGMLDRQRLGLMKRGAFLINTGRGPLVDETALADMLNSEHLAGAGLDVLSSEPPGADNPLFQAKNCYITPHIAWATRSARERLMKIAVENVRAFLEGRLQNVIGS